jgi:erythritol transport system ATP-binding protein
MSVVDATTIMRARAINKVFGATHALRDVDFAVQSGQVTVLFGENGAGKSALMKILAGIESPTTGGLELDGEPVVLSGARDAADRGIAMIHQELSLFPNLSIADNLFMAREQMRHGMSVDQAGQRERARELLERLEEPLDPDTMVGDLRLGQQQLVEIARALVQEARVLIMDEPTSALSAPEVEVLFRIIRELTAAGVAVVYISHHLEEALEIADHVVVLRDGALVAEAEADEVDAGWVVERMIGRDPDDLYTTTEPKVGDEVLTIENLVVTDPGNPTRRAVDGVSLRLRAGEIVGLYGLMGAGRTELLETLAGRLKPVGGEMRLDGKPMPLESIADRIALGLTLVPEDRQRDGLVQSMTVGQNMTLAALRRFVHGLFVAGDDERKAVERTISEVTVRTSGPGAPITSLSGGNQQKVVLAKALLTEPRILLLDEPTRGIDVGAKAEIFELMAEQARRGLAVLFATSEVAEALNVPDRLLVMSKGRIVREVSRGSATREEIMVASDETQRGSEGEDR